MNKNKFDDKKILEMYEKVIGAGERKYSLEDFKKAINICIENDIAKDNLSNLSEEELNEITGGVNKKFALVLASAVTALAGIGVVHGKSSHAVNTLPLQTQQEQVEKEVKITASEIAANALSTRKTTFTGSLAEALKNWEGVEDGEKLDISDFTLGNEKFKRTFIYYYGLKDAYNLLSKYNSEMLRDAAKVKKYKKLGLNIIKNFVINESIVQQLPQGWEMVFERRTPTSIMGNPMYRILGTARVTSTRPTKAVNEMSLEEMPKELPLPKL